MVFTVGIDVAKDQFHAHIVHMNNHQQVRNITSRRFDNRPGGYEGLQDWIQTHCETDQPIRIVMEASGVYHERLAKALSAGGWYVSVVLAKKARQYGRSLGLISKNDRLDAKGLAHMGAHQKLPRWEGIRRFWRRLRSLTRHKQQLEEIATEVKGQKHAGTWSLGTPSLVGEHRQQLSQQLDRQRAEVQQEIIDHLQSRPEIWEKVQGLDAIKGLSVQSIAVLLAETDGFEPFTAEGQLVSYSGYDILEDQSGRRAGPTRISKQGNSRIRRVLHFPALNVVRYEVPKFKRLWDRVYRRTKIPMKAYVAVQRKLLTICYHLWKKGEAFDPYYEQPATASEERKKVAPAEAEATLDTQL